MSYKNAHIKLRDINVLVDSRSSEYGDNYDIDLGDNSINAEKDQLIRINLTYFNMYNTLHSVNFRNGHFRVTLIRGCNCYCPIIRDSAITYQNYYAIHEIASDFAVKLGIVCQAITKIKFVVKDIKNTIVDFDYICDNDKLKRFISIHRNIMDIETYVEEIHTLD
jgi:hypothetical protein